MFSSVLISFFGQKIIKKLNQSDSVLDLEKDIKTYIHQNISNVSVDSICNEFNVSTNRLYKIMNNQKPGKYIQQQRIKLVRSLRAQNLSENEIHKKTGFSVSYLKQLK